MTCTQGQRNDPEATVVWLDRGNRLTQLHLTSSNVCWRPASTAELAGLAGYFALLIVGTDVLNVRLGVEALTAAVILPAAISRRLESFARDWWFFLIGLVMWNVSGPIAAYSPFPLHLDFMLQADHHMFFGHDAVTWMQRTFADYGRGSPLDIVSFVTYNLHLPEPYIAGYILWRLNRELYLQFAAAALVVSVLGFIAFVVYPAVPPWLAAQRYGEVPGVYNGFGLILHRHPLPFHGTPLFYAFQWRGDAVAAFPSEHAAFPLLEFLAFSRLGRPWLGLFVWPLWVVFVVVYLGEHWVIDALAGWLLALVAFFAVRGVIRV
ncbi:MAG: phosphatase PAP2 family protein [Chloroflexota bacterium]